MISTKARWAVDGEGAWVSFLAPTLKTAQELTAIAGTLDVTVKPHKAKRSKDANALMWELCTLISERLSKESYISKEAVYRDAVKSVGRVTYIVCQDKDVETVINDWSHKGIGWFSEVCDDARKYPNAKVLALYAGTSTYDTAEMSKVIDYLHELAVSLDIVLTETRYE